MDKGINKMRLCITLLVLNLLFIWGNSLLPGPVSAAISGYVKQLLSNLLNMGDSHPGTGHGLLRKIAHVTEFTCLGGLLMWLISMMQKKMITVPAGGLLAAGVDETIQLFVPGRGAAVTDVMIDMLGVCLGMGFVYLCLTIQPFHKR